MPASTELFKQFPNEVFIETGTFYGTGVELALSAGFKRVISIELSEALFAGCAEKFKNEPRVELHMGDSADALKRILPEINTPITFWLDAHCSGGETAMGRDFCPCLRELAEIKKHPINTHTILIDDVRLFLTHNFGGIDLGFVVEDLWKINEGYAISRADGHCPFDILIAQIPAGKL